MTADGDRTLTWNADNKPISITRTGVGTTTFAYSGDGARVKKVGPTKTLRYVGTYEHHVTDVVKVKHIVAGGLRLVTKVVGGTSAGTYYPRGDHLGSLNVLTNSSGTEVQRLTDRPFGESHSNQGTKDFAKHRSTGQEEDPETGLYYYHARYYNPALGRFISPYSLVPEPGNPQSLNRYSYVENNPVNKTDPTGHWSLGKFFKGLFAKLVGIFVNPMFSTFAEAGVTRAMTGGSYWKYVQVTDSAGMGPVESGKTGRPRSAGATGATRDSG